MNIVDFYIGRDDYLFFFPGKNLKICSRSNLIFRGSTFDFFKVQFISFVKWKANSTIEHKKNVKVTKNVIDFKFR